MFIFSAILLLVWKYFSYQQGIRELLLISFCFFFLLYTPLQQPTRKLSPRGGSAAAPHLSHGCTRGRRSRTAPSWGAPRAAPRLAPWHRAGKLGAGLGKLPLPPPPASSNAPACAALPGDAGHIPSGASDAMEPVATFCAGYEPAAPLCG